MRRSPRLRRLRRYWFRPLLGLSETLLRAVCLADLMAVDTALAQPLQDTLSGLPHSTRRTEGDWPNECKALD
jgi:hypothetical protein